MVVEDRNGVQPNELQSQAIRAAYPDKSVSVMVFIFDRDISDTTPFEIDQALVDAAQSQQIKKNRTLP